MDEALDALQEQDPQEVASALESKAPDVYKQIRNPAFKQGKREVQSELESAQDKIASLRKEKQSIEEKAEQNTPPEVEEVQQKYEKKIDSLNQQIDDLQTEKQEAVESWKQKTREERGRSFQDKVFSELTSRGVDPDYAEFKAQQATAGERVQFAGDDGLDIEVYEADPDVPLNVPDDASKHEAFADTLVEEVPDKFIEDSRPGSTLNGEPESTPGGKTMRREEFEQMAPAEQKEFALNGGTVVD